MDTGKTFLRLFIIKALIFFLIIIYILLSICHTKLKTCLWVFLLFADNICKQFENVGPDLGANCFDTLMVFPK